MKYRNGGRRLQIDRDGVFELLGSAYRIPRQFSLRQKLAYRSLVAPIPQVRGERELTPERRLATRRYLLWRAAACVIPEFRAGVPEQLSLTDLEAIHRWIARYRPGLYGN